MAETVSSVGLVKAPSPQERRCDPRRRGLKPQRRTISLRKGGELAGSLSDCQATTIICKLDTRRPVSDLLMGSRAEARGGKGVQILVPPQGHVEACGGGAACV